jgi:hypothetical protein
MSTKWSTEVLNNAGGTPDFGALLKDESTVILLRGKNVFGDMIYCYLKIAFPDIEKLQEALTTGTGTFNISDFGTVIAAGKGEPPPEVKAEVALAYPMLDKPKPIPTTPGAKPAEKQEKKNWDEY